MASKKQMIIVSVLGVAFVALAIYRLRGSSDTPSSAEASTTDIAIVPVGPIASPRETVESIVNSVSTDNWRLPSVEALLANKSGDFPRPTNDPFVLSESLRTVVQGARAGTIEEPDDPIANTDPMQEQRTPTFRIRSAYEVLGQWFVEIDGRTYGVGDIVEGFQILEVTSRRMRAIRVGGEDGPIPVQDAKPTSVILVCGQSTGLVGRQWVRSGDEANGRRVISVGIDGVVTETISDKGDETGQAARGVEVQVDYD